MDLQTLRWFQLACDGVTLTEIADLEMVSQPAVSRALARLERELGTPLLRRSGRRLTPTRAGAAFKRHVDAAVHQVDDGVAAVEQTLDPATGTVGVAFTASLGTWLVPELIGGFGREHPGVGFELTAVGSLPIGRALGDVAVDLVRSTEAPPAAGHAWRTLLREPLVLALPADHRLAGRAEVGLADVAQDPFVVLPPRSPLRQDVDALLAGAGVGPRVAMTAPDLPTARACVASGLGVAVLPGLWDSTTEPESRRLAHCSLTDPGAERRVRLIWEEPDRLLPAARAFRRHVLGRVAAGDLPRPRSAGEGRPA